MLLVGLRIHDLVKIAQIVSQSAVKEGLEIRGTDHTFVSMEQMLEVSHIRIGEGIYSPLISPGRCDLLVGCLPGEAARLAAEYLSSKGTVVVNTRDITPLMFWPPFTRYPGEEEILGFLSTLSDRLITLDAVALATEAGGKDLTNFVMLGAALASGLLPFSYESLKDTIGELVYPGDLENSLNALEAGYKSLS